jgi:hypothetical protein
MTDDEREEADPAKGERKPHDEDAGDEGLGSKTGAVRDGETPDDEPGRKGPNPEQTKVT